MWTEFSNYHWGWMGFGLIHMALIWGFFILVIVSMIQFITSDKETPSMEPVQSPTAVLKLRYARGEISQQQFEQLMREIPE